MLRWLLRYWRHGDRAPARPQTLQERYPAAPGAYVTSYTSGTLDDAAFVSQPRDCRLDRATQHAITILRDQMPEDVGPLGRAWREHAARHLEARGAVDDLRQQLARSRWPV